MAEQMGKTAKCPGCKKEDCTACRVLAGLNTVKKSPVSFPVGFVADKGAGLGLAFDVGTTTLAAMLWDLETGRLLSVEAAANPQSRYGADVISRLQAAGNPKRREEMQACLVKKLDELSYKLLQGKTAKKAVVVGNTVMCELLLGIEPAGLMKAPFVPDYQESQRRMGEELGFEHLADTCLRVLPPIGGYVGADALAVYGCVERERENQKVLALDIGTNGEVLLWCEDRCMACSTAAGPALEGGAVTQGMRAVSGAIDRVSLAGQFPMQDIACHVVGEEKPLGICGSGLVALLALLLELGVVDGTGYMRSRQEAARRGVPERICRRILGEDRERRFLLTGEDTPVFLTVPDIRQLQLAIAAIRGASEVLLQRAGFEAGELDAIYLAGAFGCYIDLKSGKRLGLFPEVDSTCFVQAGNLAGTGASMALLSDKERKKLEAAVCRIQHVELAEETAFQELFMRYMNFEN